jgi:hypothetical protein
MTLCLVGMIFVLAEDIQYPRLHKLTSREICLYLYGVTIHFSVNNFDNNLPKFADLTQQIAKFFDKCCPI